MRLFMRTSVAEATGVRERAQVLRFRSQLCLRQERPFLGFEFLVWILELIKPCKSVVRIT